MAPISTAARPHHPLLPSARIARPPLSILTVWLWRGHEVAPPVRGRGGGTRSRRWHEVEEILDTGLLYALRGVLLQIPAPAAHRRPPRPITLGHRHRLRPPHPVTVRHSNASCFDF
uniref:Uncharacterized protein n=1 Tax=Arundo donax TaxID=35708 RepID=A0A0A9EGZ4_ARUDO